MTNPPYTIVFWDEDDVTADDNLGSDEITIQAGNVSFSSGNGTIGNATINLVESTTITDATEITVFGIPNGETTVSGNVISANDPTATEFQWAFNGFPIDGEVNSSLTMTAGGTYQCEMTNEFGCSAISAPYLFCPSITPEYDPLALEIYVADIYESYQWYYNGLEVPGGTTFYLINPALGNYAVVVTTSYGCEIESEVLTIGVSVDELNAIEKLAIYPNPSSDLINVSIDITSNSHELTIVDAQGSVVFSKEYTNLTSGTLRVELGNLSAGIYSVLLKEGDVKKVARLLVQH